MAIIAFFSGLLYYQLYYGAGGGRGEPIGTLTFKHNTTQRKFGNQALWRDIPQKVTLYNHDSVRTARQAEAVLTLKDGTEIKLEPDSMIILNVSDASVDINYQYGAIGAKGSGGKGNINIKQGDTTVTVQKGDVKLTKNSVVLTKGEASIKSGGESKKITKDQVATITNGKIEIKPLSLRPLSPEKRIFATSSKIPVKFSWSPIKGSPPVNLEVLSRSGARITRTTSKNGISLNLAAGESYSWRLSARNPNNKKLESSARQTFRIFKNFAPVPAHPRPGAQIETMENKPLVSLSWSTNEAASDYIIEISKDKSFSNSERLKSSSTYVSTRLDPGTYFCRISTNGIFPQAESTRSKTFTFSIEKKDKLSPPVPISPARGARISTLFFSAQGVAFNWRAPENIRRSEFWISPAKDFSARTIRRKLPGGFLSLKEKLPEGLYYWKVRGLDQAGQPSTEFSSAFTLNITGPQKLALLAPAPNLRMDIVKASRKGIQFSWKRPGIVGRYTVEISRTGDFKKILAQKKVTSLSAGFPSPGSGGFFWRVKLVGANGVVLTDSEARKFVIENRLPDPVLEHPARGETVDMANLNTLPLRWSATPGANIYRVKLFSSGNPVPILDTRVSETELIFQELEKLDKGNFAWSIMAEGVVAGKRVRSNEIRNNFKIVLSGEKKIDELKEPETLY